MKAALLMRMLCMAASVRGAMRSTSMGNRAAVCA